MRLEHIGAQLEACVPRLRRYARALTGERAAADDLVQDTLERAWGRLPSWSGAGELRAFARRQKDPRAASRMYAIAQALEGLRVVSPEVVDFPV